MATIAEDRKVEFTAKDMIISADSHINEPPTVFDRLPARFKDRKPVMMRGADGGDGWSFDGKTPKRTFGIEAMAGFQKKDFRLSGMRFDELRPGNWDGRAHLDDMDIDGIYGSVLHPANAIQVYTLPDRELGIACMQSYNDWLLLDFQAVDPKRIVGLPMLPVDDGMDVAIAELERVLKNGAKACFIPGMPERPYNDPYYEPLWAAASAADVSLNLHRTFGGKPDKTDWDELVNQRVSVGGIVFRYFSSVKPLTYMIFAGIFDRHPNLKIVAAEVDCGWVPFWAQTMDAHWEAQQAWFPTEPRSQAERLPRQELLRHDDRRLCRLRPDQDRPLSLSGGDDDVLDRLSAFGDDLAELAGGRQQADRRHDRGRQGACPAGECRPHLPLRRITNRRGRLVRSRHHARHGKSWPPHGRG